MEVGRGGERGSVLLTRKRGNRKPLGSECVCDSPGALYSAFDHRVESFSSLSSESEEDIMSGEIGCKKGFDEMLA
jgi:hypothetical protein